MRTPASLAACLAALWFAPAAAPAPGELFRDDFDGARLDGGAWVRGFPWCTPMRCTSTSTPDMVALPSAVTVRGGMLRITARRAPTVADGALRGHTSGMVSTGGLLGEAPAGYRLLLRPPVSIEVRARIPAGRGLWPAIWLLPPAGRWPPEIDILEVLGHDPHRAHFTLHHEDDGHRQRGTSWRSPVPLSAGFHTYGLEWRAGSLHWSIDGVRRAVDTGPGIPRGPMYLIINLQVGGTWPGEPDASTRFPATMLVDRVVVRRIPRVPRRAAQAGS